MLRWGFYYAVVSAVGLFHDNLSGISVGLAHDVNTCAWCVDAATIKVEVFNTCLGVSLSCANAVSGSGRKGNVEFVANGHCCRSIGISVGFYKGATGEIKLRNRVKRKCLVVMLVFSFDIKEIVFQRVEMKYGLKKSGHIL